MATQRDVAERGGVTQATVSRVFNGGARVDEETRERVLHVAKELGYKPHQGNDARRLACRRHGSPVRTNVISIVRHSPPVPALASPWVMSIIEGIAVRLYEDDIQVLLADTREERVPTNLRAGYVDGVLAICPQPAIVPALSRLDVPVVGVANEVLPVHVCQDDHAATRLATEHLISLGHTRIAFFLYLPWYPNMSARRRGYEDALQAAGLPVDGELVVCDDSDDSDPSKDPVYLLRDLLQCRSEVTAVVAHNDWYATQILQMVRTIGIRVPEQLSIIGTDDMPESRVSHPPLTTLRLPLKEIGEAAADLLLQWIQEQEPQPGRAAEAPATVSSRRLPVTLVVRESTARPGGSEHFYWERPR